MDGLTPLRAPLAPRLGDRLPARAFIVIAPCFPVSAVPYPCYVSDACQHATVRLDDSLYSCGMQRLIVTYHLERA